MTTPPLVLRPAWLAQRRALHDIYVSVAGGVDASRLMYLGDQRQRFSNAEAAALWATQAGRTYAQPPANHVYVHVPFCKSICSFCNYERLKPGNAENMGRWLARVIESAEVLGPALRGLQFHNLYLGGGTPSMLPAEMLEGLFSALDRLLPFHPRAIRSFEFDPAAMNGTKLDVLRRFGFSQFSFGVQTLRPEVNADHHRGHQDRDLVQRRLDDFAPFARSTNCDFLLGLAGTEPEDMYQQIDDVLGMANRPTNMDIFMMVASPAYVSSHFGGDLAAFEAHMDRFRRSAPARLAQIAAAKGYRLDGNNSHSFRMLRTDLASIVDDEASMPGYTQYTHIQGAPLNLLGLGTSARSHLFGSAQFDYEDPNGDVMAEGPGSFVGRSMTLSDEARAFVIVRLRDKRALDFAEFEGIFGSPLPVLLPEVVAALLAEGVVARDEGGLRMAPRTGSQLLHDLLWVVDSAALEREVAGYLGVLLSPTDLAAFTKIPSGTVLEGLRVVHEEGATRFEGGPRKLRVRWAPVSTEGRASVVGRVESDGDTVPKVFPNVLRALEQRVVRALAARPIAPERRQLRVVG